LQNNSTVHLIFPVNLEIKCYSPELLEPEKFLILIALPQYILPTILHIFSINPPLYVNLNDHQILHLLSMGAH